MGKKTRNRAAAVADAGDNPRRPCPCGSGKRYKNCHGAGDDVIVIRPFEGLAAEPDLIAMREFLPSATAELPLRSSEGGAVTLGSVLPGASAALVRDDGEQLLGMQVQTRSGDLSADLAGALAWARSADPGSSLAVVGPAQRTAERLQDLLDPDAPLDVTLHKDFSWWLTGEPDAEETAALERANSVILPTERVDAPGVRAAYWVDTGTKAHLRWVRPEPEDRLMGALARLSERGELELSEDSRYAGSFRAHGLLVPVWDLDREMHSSEWSGPAETFAGRLDEALAGLDDEP
ncbi:MAG: SEC-C domain-containing protein, partial [Actinomycetota bacterium]|nr:SEC-C domain-containing protein [Actinomycetota bacterium]